jgi:hypothetical protein
MADAIEWVAESARLLAEKGPPDRTNQARLDELCGLLNKENAWLRFRAFPDDPTPEAVAVDAGTAEAMASHVRECMKSWFEHVQKTLYGREGVTRLAAKLETISDLRS